MNLELATPVGKRRAWRVSTRSGGAVTYLREKATLRQELGDVGREDDVPAGREDGEGARGQSRNFSVGYPGVPAVGCKKRSGCARVNRGIGASRSIRAETSGAKRSITP